MYMRFHQRTAELLAFPLSATDCIKADMWAKQHSVKMPESVREWYSLDQAIEVLSRHSNRDQPLTPSEFELIEHDNDHIIRFMFENQGCASWGILLDGNDDPPVVVNQEPSWWDRPRWEYCTEQFSQFVYLRVFDWQYLNRQWGNVQESHDEAFLDAATPNDAMIDYLKKSFVEEPSSHDWPDLSIRRYSREHQRIVIWQNKDSAQWLLLAADRELRKQLIDEIVAQWEEYGMQYTKP